MDKLLEFKELTKSYKQGNNTLEVLKNISYVFPYSGFISIIGKSGCGKSTIFNIVSLLDKKDKGSVLYSGKNIDKFNQKEKEKYLQNEIATISQSYNLLNELTVLENIVLPCEISGKSEDRNLVKSSLVLKRFNLTKIKNRKVKFLSGGEKQRVALARALINEPKIILADEPTGALDSKNSKIVCDYLKELSKDILVIFISHNNELVNKYSDTILLLENKNFKEIKSKTSNDKKPLKSENYCKKRVFWHKKILKIFAKGHLLKNCISVLAMSFSFASVITCLSYYSNYPNSISKVSDNFLTNNSGKISITNEYKIENSNLVFKKIIRPKYEEIKYISEEVPSIYITQNLSYFLPSFVDVHINGVRYDDIEFIPYYNPKYIARNKLTPSNNFEDIYINDVLKNRFNNDIKISLNYVNDFVIETGDLEKPKINESFRINKKLNIVGVIDELSFLNAPKIYYSYSAFKNYLTNYEFENISYYYKKVVTAFDLVKHCDNNSRFSSYSLLYFVRDLDEINTIKRLYNNQNSDISIDSSVFLVNDSFVNIMDLFSLCLMAFVFVLVFIAILIEFLLSYSSYLSESYLSGVLSMLGASRNNVSICFYIEQIILSFIKFIFSIGLSYLLCILLNNIFIQNFNVFNVFTLNITNMFNIPMFFIILFLLVVIILPLLIEYIVIRVCKYKQTILEIKE